MQLGEPITIDQGHCGICRLPLNMTVSADDLHPRPDPGDFTICLHCGGINVFGDDLKVRAPNEAELAEAMQDDEFSQALKLAESVIRDRGKYIGTA